MFLRSTCLLSVLMYRVIESLECFSCGVFLAAPSRQCRGTPLSTNCDPDQLGCVTITAPNLDGTYYVEKRCAEREDALVEGCVQTTVRGLRGEECLCKGDLCNSSPNLAYTPIFLVFFYVLHNFLR